MSKEFEMDEVRPSQGLVCSSDRAAAAGCWGYDWALLLLHCIVKLGEVFVEIESPVECGREVKSHGSARRSAAVACR